MMAVGVAAGRTVVRPRAAGQGAAAHLRVDDHPHVAAHPRAAVHHHAAAPHLVRVARTHVLSRAAGDRQIAAVITAVGPLIEMLWYFMSICLRMLDHSVLKPCWISTRNLLLILSTLSATGWQW